MRSTKLLLTAAAVGVAGTALVLAQDKGAGGPPTTGTAKPAEADPKPAEPAAPDLEATEFPDIPRLPKPDWKIGDRMPKVLPTDDAAARINKRILLAAFREISFDRELMAAGGVGQSEWEGLHANLLASSKAIAAAANRLWDKPDDLRPWLEWRVAVAKDYESAIKEREQGGLARPQAVLAAHRERLDAELALLALLAKAPNR